LFANDRVFDTGVVQSVNEADDRVQNVLDDIGPESF
jgi:hypothetical protein